MELDETGFPQPTGEVEELEADSVVLALGQEADLSLLEGVEGIEVDDGVVQVGPNMMTGHQGIFAGGDMVPAERTVTVGIGHGKQAARHIDGWLRGAAYEPPPEPEIASFDKLNTWYYADAPRTAQPRLEIERRRGTFDEVVGGLDDRQRPVRGAPLHVLRQLLHLRQLLRRLPGQRGAEARRGPGGELERLRDRARLLQGLRDLRRRMPVRRDRDGAGADLAPQRSTAQVHTTFTRPAAP